jgi:hypothetical protein
MENAKDLYHVFPELIKTGADVGRVTLEVGRDGNIYSWLRIPGSVNGVSGEYTFIKDAATNLINHRFFEPF